MVRGLHAGRMKELGGQEVVLGEEEGGGGEGDEGGGFRW